MNKIKRYQDYSSDYDMTLEFINSFDLMINENGSSDGDWKSVMKKFKNDLKLHLSLIATFGAGIGAFVPVVQKMMGNMNISTEITFDKVVLLTICSLTIIYLEEKKFKNSKEQEQLTSDSKSMLEELKMMGLGNGIVKLVIKSIESIKNLFNIIGKHIGATVGGVVDMFAYTSFLLPVMNGIYFLIGQYDLTPETIVQNLVGISAGVITLIAKHGVGYIINKIKDKFKIKKDVLDDVVDDMENTTIQKFNVYGNDDAFTDSEPINDNRLI
jgi:hypothetical protein